MHHILWIFFLAFFISINLWIINGDEIFRDNNVKRKKNDVHPLDLQERRLYNDLFIKQDYDPLVRPVLETSDNITVQFGIALIQIISIEEKKQVLKTNVWLRLVWPDYHLRWDPAEYGNVASLRVTPNHVWKPDLVLFNNADGKYNVTFMSNVVLYPDGSVLWVPPTIYRTSCSMDMHYFPFDEHVCTLEFGSWTYNADEVAFSWYGLPRIDLNDYIYGGTWDVIECPGYHRVTYNNYTNHNDIKIIFELKIRRKTLFYTINLILPCVFVEFLNICVFFLPPASDEKMSFTIAIMLALVVFLLLITSLLPPSSTTVPLIAKFLLFTFVVNVITSTVTCVIINWNYRTPRTHYMNKWVKIVFLDWLPKLLVIKRPGQDDPNKVEIKKKIENNSSKKIKKPQQYNNTKCVSCGFYVTSVPEESENLMDISPECRKAVEAIRYVSAHLKLEDDYDEVMDDWKFIAMVLDRLHFYIFLIVTIGGAVGCFINAPNIFENSDQKFIINNINDSGYAS